jgi:hypothetical protein
MTQLCGALGLVQHGLWFMDIAVKLKVKVTLEHATKSQRRSRGGLVVSMLASGSRVRGFKSGRSRWILNEC